MGRSLFLALALGLAAGPAVGETEPMAETRTLPSLPTPGWCEGIADRKPGKKPTKAWKRAYMDWQYETFADPLSVPERHVRLLHLGFKRREYLSFSWVSDATSLSTADAALESGASIVVRRIPEAPGAHSVSLRAA